MRWMNRLATTLIALAVIAGPPLLAAGWLWHRPWQWPTRAQLEAWAAQPFTAGTIIAGCVMVAGITWLLLVTYLTRRASHAVRRRLRRLRHLPIPTPAQMTAGSMAGLAAFTLPAAAAAHPPQPPTTTGTPQPADPAVSGHDRDRPVPTEPAGITLPGGGWIPYPTAAAITALAALAWLRRRRDYRPDPDQPRGHDTDPDLQPPPAGLHVITTALNDAQQADDHRTNTPLTAQELPVGVLLLSGPGAAPAARGILVTAALGSIDGITEPTVSVHPDDLRSLLPTDVPTAVAGTATASANPPAVRRPVQDDWVDLHVWPAGGQNNSESRTGTLLVLRGGDTAPTHRWHVTVEGTATGTGIATARRLCMLDSQTAADLLTFIRSERPAAPVADPPQPTGPHRSTAVGPGHSTEAQLTLLGGCRLVAAGEPVLLRRTAGMQILAYLAVYPHGATRSELICAAWPHLPAATISQRLHTTIADLRRQLRPLIGDDPITRHDDRYHLNTHAIATDLQPWHAAVHAMTHAVGTAARHHACRRVADLYTGELAAGQSWPWLTPAREQARRAAIDACTYLAEHSEPQQALDWLHRATTIDPYNEYLHHRAADLLRATGDHAGATDLIERLNSRIPSERLHHHDDRTPAVDERQATP